jgi:ABC-type dipeptide/oligopeptide/nickel transport system permease component
MWSFVARRVATAVVTFFGITLATFVLIHAVPGDPISFYIGKSGFHATQQSLAAVRAAHHLDEPLPVQYGWWLRDLLHLDLGESIISRRPVAERIAEKLPNTFVLNSIAFFLSVLIGIPLGVWSAIRSGRKREQATSVGLYVLAALPTFWVALVLMQLFAVKLEWLPLFGMSGFRSAILPVTVLVVSQLAIYARFTRAAYAEVLSQEFMNTARAKGLSAASVTWRHGFRNALLPLITLFGLTVPYLLSGSVIVEQIFQWDGIGQLFVDAILGRDYPVVMALTVVTALVTLAASFVTDLLYALADPRIRIGDPA